VAGSLPSLRRFFKSHVGNSRSERSKGSLQQQQPQQQQHVDLVTFGGTGGQPGRELRKSSFRNPMETVTSVHSKGKGGWSALGDDSSDKGILGEIRGDQLSRGSS
jgi:hypothetical protein